MNGDGELAAGDVLHADVAIGLDIGTDDEAGVVLQLVRWCHVGVTVAEAEDSHGGAEHAFGACPGHEPSPGLADLIVGADVADEGDARGGDFFQISRP